MKVTPTLLALFLAAVSAQAADPQTSTVTEEQFLTVMKTSCLRCHKVCNSVATMVTQKWIVPGQPEISPVYKVLGKSKNKKLQNGRYHDVSPESKAIIEHFVAQYKADTASGK